MLLGKPLLNALNRMGCGGLILDAGGQVIDLNPAAARFLRENNRADDEPLSNGDARAALKVLLRAGETRFTLDQETWAVVQRPEQRSLVLHTVQLSNGSYEGPHTMVVLIDLDQAPQPNPATLQKIFGLTPAEAKLAVLLSKGEALPDIAQASKVTMSTARKQLATIFAKTRTHRQAELVALLARVAILP